MQKLTPESLTTAHHPLRSPLQATVEQPTSMGAGAAKLATSGAQAEAAYRVESAGPAADSVLCAALSKHGLPAAARLARRVGAEQSMALAAADAKHGANGHY